MLNLSFHLSKLGILTGKLCTHQVKHFSLIQSTSSFTKPFRYQLRCAVDRIILALPYSAIALLIITENLATALPSHQGFKLSPSFYTPFK